MITKIENVDLLFTGADLYTLNEDEPVIYNGAIAVVGNTIAAIGPAADVAAAGAVVAAWRASAAPGQTPV